MKEPEIEKLVLMNLFADWLFVHRVRRTVTDFYEFYCYESEGFKVKHYSFRYIMFLFATQFAKDFPELETIRRWLNNE